MYKRRGTDRCISLESIFKVDRQALINGTSILPDLRTVTHCN